MKKSYKKWLIVLASVLIFLLGLSWLFTFLYADEIKQYGISQVNQLVNTEISVEQIDFSVFEKFPDASLAFKNVTAKEVTNRQEKENLFSVESIYLQFNILKLIKGDYRLKAIAMEDGEVNIHVDAEGRDNFHFWKTGNDEDNDFALELNQVTLKNVELTFKNDVKKTLLKQQLKKLNLSGTFSESEYELSVDGLIFTHVYQSGKAKFLRDRNVFINVSLAVNQETNNYLIKKGAISVEDLHFFLSGDFTNGEEASLINLTYTGNKLAIPALISLFPEDYQAKLSDYRSDGEIKLKGHMRGWISATKSPEINLDFNIHKGSIDHKPSGIVLHDIILKGGLTNGSRKNLRSTVITIDSARAGFGHGTISGTYKISNLENPMLDMTARASGIMLEELLSFLPSDSIETLKGELDLDLRMRGYIQDLSKMTVADFRKARTHGKATIRNGTFAFKKSKYQLDSLNTVLQFNNNDVKVNRMSGKVLQNDFRIEGFFKNLLPYLFAKNESLFLRADLYSHQLNWDDFMPPSSGSNKETERFIFSDKVSFDLKATVNAFRFRNFRATSFQGIMSYHPRVFHVREASFKSMKGHVKGALELDAKNPNKLKLKVDGIAEKVNVEQLFRSFDNFGQKVISAKNLKGICTAKVQFSSSWNEKWNINPSSIHTIADIFLEKGELIAYKPVLALSKFIEVEELNHIRFSSLRNVIEIHDQKIYFPEMDIKSSALNLKLSGVHSFNNEIEYHFNLLLRDILSKKARKAKKENEEFGGHEEDDGLGRTTLFLKMTGTVDNTKISYDRKGLRKKWSEDLKTEKESIKSILKEEFGKQSETEKEQSSREVEDYNFEMEWEDDDQPEKQEQKKETTIKKDKKTKPKKGLNKWMNKITQPDEQEYEEYDPNELD